MMYDEQKWLEKICDEMGSLLLGYLKAYLRNEHDAEDVLQQVFIRLLQSNRKDYEIHNLRSFLFTLASHEAQRFLSKNKKHRLSAINSIPDNLLENKPDSSLSPQETAGLQEAFLSLPWEQQEVIYLKIYAQMTFEEISLSLSIPLNTVASRYRYGMEKIKKNYGLC
ncbi:MAG: sigma-70 family RNA polymerase sigma factor [Candidatus Brocadiae bacterium]|nr:sigma-70 family RNA polymerase sigma factor [Candidatus Brocadiia bacterium]